LRKGSTGPYVVECQTDLITLGYSCGPKGADGWYGDATISAVKAFQKDHGLSVDGVCGPKTWDALDKAMDDLKPDPEPGPVDDTYTVKITGLDLTQATAIAANYPGNSEIIKEE
jgi:peptidoglycan hydrolase-like protein with peptidoglycan-binding domain